MASTFKELMVYQDSYELMCKIHEAIKVFPIYEQYELGSQMRRASKSIPTNIAEGWGRRDSAKEFKKYISVCIGSANEMEVHLETAGDLGYLQKGIVHEYSKLYLRLGAQLVMLRRNWRSSS